MSFYLILFERQARRVHIKEEDWVTNLVGLLPLEMANLIAREPEEKANDYEHIKVDDLTEKLDDYENARQYNQATKATLSLPYRNSYPEKPSMCNRKCHAFGEGYRQELNNRSGYDKRNSFQKSVTCFNCGRDFAGIRKTGEERPRVKLLSKISYGGTEYEAVVDSGAQISVFKSSVVGKEVDYKGHIMLQPTFGDCLKAELKEVDIGLVTNEYITPVIKTVVATVDGLNTDILLDTETYEALLEQERIYSPRFTAAMNLRSDSSKKSLDESVNTEKEEQEPTITEYDEENENNTEKFKKQQQICDTLQEAWNFARRNKGGYVIENDILYHDELLGGNRIKQLVVPEMRKRKRLEIAHESVFGAHLGAHKTIQRIKFSFY
ncbi:retrovirus-related Pol polyprotein from transposon opus [Trichonephila clavipes]|nr:retrovirus-related Pol polyprotein from transposon opus [Trichonephila clavipes]